MAKHFTLEDLRKSPAAKLNGHLFAGAPARKKQEIPSPVPAEPGRVSVGVQVVPLSVNRAWKGQRFRSDEYKAYEARLDAALPNLEMPAPPYRVFYEFGFSSPLADFDNPVKPLTDVLQKKYGFNDKLIMEAHIRKMTVPKGEEYFTVRIETIEQ